MGLKKKIKTYIKDDRPAKLKSLIASEDVDVNGIRFSGGRNALHYCAQFGSADMMRCLLRLECDPTKPDKERRLPLHIALYQCLDQGLEMASQTYEGMVSLLIRVSPMGLDVEDKDGATCQDLLKRVKARMKYGQERGKGKTRMTGHASMEDEVQWQQKLADEMQFEFTEQQPHNDYIEDYSDRDEQESFASWSERLYHEWRGKKLDRDPRLSAATSSNCRKRRDFTTHSEKLKKSKTQTQADQDEELRKAREEMRRNYKPPPVEQSTSKSASEVLLSKKERYEKRFTHFFTSPPARGSVTFGGIPWPCANMDKLADTLFCDLPDNKSLTYKKFLRNERVRWHPDKFFQKFRDFLHPNHVDKIMGRVKVISQTLNAMVT